VSGRLLEVRDLAVRFATDEGLVTAVEGVSFDVAPGEILGLVGESGSGKSVTAKSIMRLNAANARYDGASRIALTADGRTLDVLALKRERELRPVRGDLVSMVFQEPMASFAPALSIGAQMVEQLRLHRRLSRREAREIAIDMLAHVGISEPAKRFEQYAFELSGGMRQRAMIAMALSTRPRLLIADEPTTALDVTIQAQVLELIRGLVAEYGMGVVLITHDLGVVAQTCDRVAVMYLGRLVETGPVRAVLRRPRHPYTRGLINALPKLDDLDAPLTPVPGDIPSPLERPSGCLFHTRCPVAIAGRCEHDAPTMERLAPGVEVACFKAGTDAEAEAA
jgi:oligopeptide/dipeptide ABC transporter ATP-binding protein